MRKRHQSKFYLVLERRILDIEHSKFSSKLDIALNKDEEDNLLNEFVLNGALVERSNYAKYDIHEIGKNALDWFYSNADPKKDKKKREKIKSIIDTLQPMNLTGTTKGGDDNRISKYTGSGWLGYKSSSIFSSSAFSKDIKILTDEFNKVLDIVNATDKADKEPETTTVSTTSSSGASDSSSKTDSVKPASTPTESGSDDSKTNTLIRLSVDGETGFRLDKDDIDAIEKRRPINKILMNKRTLFIFGVCMYKYMNTPKEEGGPEEEKKTKKDKDGKELPKARIVKLFNVLKIYEYFIDNEKKSFEELKSSISTNSEERTSIKELNTKISNEIIDIFKDDIAASNGTIKEIDFCKNLTYSIVANRICDKTKAESTSDFRTAFADYKAEITAKKDEEKTTIDKKIEDAKSIYDLTKDAFIKILRKYDEEFPPKNEEAILKKINFIVAIFGEPNEEEKKTIENGDEQENPEMTSKSFGSGKSSSRIEEISLDFFNISGHKGMLGKLFDNAYHAIKDKITKQKLDETSSISEDEAKRYVREVNNLIENLNSKKCRIDILLTYMNLWMKGNYNIDFKYISKGKKGAFIKTVEDINKRFFNIKKLATVLTECYEGHGIFTKSKKGFLKIDFDNELSRIFKELSSKASKNTRYRLCFKVDENGNVPDTSSPESLKEIEIG